MLAEPPHVASARRPIRSTPELDAAELAWWEANADLENDFLWVQTPDMQRRVRRGYLAPVVAAAQAAGGLLDIGCGAGWLSILLAELGASRVVGVDFSPAQIRLAEQAAGAAGVTDRVTFRLGSANDAGSERFGAAIMHAFLHHLSVEEIQTVTRSARSLLRPEGRLFLLEPVLRQGPASEAETRLLVHFRRLMSIANLGPERFWRPSKSSAELAIRARIKTRWPAGQPGPSPKERPFSPGELEQLLEPEFRVESVRPVLALSQILACELLLVGLSYPRLSRLLRGPLMAAVARLDKKYMALTPSPTKVWVFHLFECAARAGGD